MTHTYAFNRKTGELARGGKLLSLKYEHRLIFGGLTAVASGVYVEGRALAELIGATPEKVATEVHRLRARVVRLGFHIECKRHVGYRLVVSEMPVWRPNIPPPAEVTQ